MSEQFDKGDTVRLRSCGPIMTVTDLDVGTDHSIQCDWFDDKGVNKAAVFPAEALEKAQLNRSIGIA